MDDKQKILKDIEKLKNLAVTLSGIKITWAVTMNIAQDSYQFHHFTDLLRILNENIDSKRISYVKLMEDKGE